MTFEPKYPVTQRIGGLLVVILGCVSLIAGLLERKAYLGIVGLVFLGFSLVGLVTTIKKVIFTDNEVTLTRLLLPPLVYPLSGIDDIGEAYIKIGNRFIFVGDMENGYELMSMFRNLIHDRKIQPAQIQGRLGVEEALVKQAAKLSMIPTIISGFVLNYLFSNFIGLELDIRLAFLFSFVFIFSGIYFILKRQHEAA